MARAVDSLLRPPNARVRVAGNARRDDSELFLMDSVASEVNRLAGADVTWWQADIAGSRKDPLYGEPLVRKWKGPFKLQVFVEFPQLDVKVSEKGSEYEFAGTAWVARVDIEATKMQLPMIGDVLRFWDVPFYAEFGDMDRTLPNPDRAWFFDVTKVDRDGQPHDTPGFVGFKCDIKRKTEFGAERKIFGV